MTLCNALRYDRARRITYVCERRPGHGPTPHLDATYAQRWPYEVHDPMRPASLALLNALALHDHGDGVLFTPTARGRWVLDGTEYAVNAQTFRVLERMRFIVTGGSLAEPVHVTPAGLAYLGQPVDGAAPELAAVDDEPADWPAHAAEALARAETDGGLRTMIARALTGHTDGDPPATDHQVGGFTYDLADRVAAVAEALARRVADVERTRAVTIVCRHLAGDSELTADAKALCDRIAGDRRIRVPTPRRAS